MKLEWLFVAGAIEALLVGCRTSDGASAAPDAPASAAAVPPPSATPAQAALDSLDRRTPVPLLPMMANHQKQNMRDHLVAVQEIIAAVGAEDFEAVQRSVTRIGYSEQMGQMCERMGAGAPGFTELALEFHHSADTIGEAARAHDAAGTLKALGNTVAVCTSCHRSFRQRVVDEVAWAALAKRPMPASSSSR